MESNPATPSAESLPDPAGSFTGQQAARLKVFAILFSAFLVMIAATAISMGYTVHRYWESVLQVEIERSLTQKRLFASRVSADHTSGIDGKGNLARPAASARPPD
jgi:hypothetical protein